LAKEDIPQGLNPVDFIVFSGTAEAEHFQDSLNSNFSSSGGALPVQNDWFASICVYWVTGALA
jgi:hypothetical protein